MFPRGTKPFPNVCSSSSHIHPPNQPNAPFAMCVGAQDLFGKLKEGMDPGFRLFITALPNDEFPLGLLQMCTKVCVES